MTKKNLFICGTPLQSLVIKRIIEHEGFEKNNCALFFYAYVNNSKHNYYYDQLSEYFSQSVYYLSANKYPRYVIESRRIFSGIDFENIYFAAVNSSFVLSALSLGKHKAIFTFDDGAANISPTSPYAAKHGLSLKKYLALRLFGNRYTIESIRRETQLHYTIYPGFKNNISSNLQPLSIFPKTDTGHGAGKCSLILGTVYHEVEINGDVESLALKISRFAQSLDGDVYYLPHPRAMEVNIEGAQLLESEKIAEEIIAGLYSDIGTIDLYGFCSSTQLNLVSLTGVKNYFLSSVKIRDSVQAMYGVASKGGVSPGSLIDLDQYGE